MDEAVSGLGDILLQGEYFFVTGTRTRPWFTGLLRLELPTADEEKGLGTGEPDVKAQLDLIQPVGRSHLFVSAGYTWVGDPPDFDLENIVSLGAGWSWRLGDSPGNNIHVFLENRTNPVPGEKDRLDVTVGASARFGEGRRGRFNMAVSAGLTETAEDFGLSLLLGRVF